MKEQEQYPLLSQCCGAKPLGEVCNLNSGFCSDCRDGTQFYYFDQDGNEFDTEEKARQSDEDADKLLNQKSMTEVKTKPLSMWTRKEFDALPCREWNEDIEPFDSMVILPLRTMHDSGFRCMDFVAIRKDVPICRLSGCSDVIHIDGIGGYGEKESRSYTLVPPKGWCIDCLKVSGLLRIFSDGILEAGTALSSFNLYSHKTPTK